MHPLRLARPARPTRFARVVYDPGRRADRPLKPAKLAASWFPAPAIGKLPDWSCVDVSAARTDSVLGAGGGLCGVVQAGGTAHAGLAPLATNPRVTVYGAKTGTTDSLVVIAQHPAACAAWNASHAQVAQLTCGKRPPDDSLLVLAFGVASTAPCCSCWRCSCSAPVSARRAYARAGVRRRDLMRYFDGVDAVAPLRQISPARPRPCASAFA